MPLVRALIAEEDLNLHQIVHDILEICFKNVRIDRALNYDSLYQHLRERGDQYDLILYDVDFDDRLDRDALPAIRVEFAHLLPAFVLMVPRKVDLETWPHAQGLPYVAHPFSLDEFSQIVTHVCAKVRKARGPADPSAGGFGSDEESA
jgi:hypothetical protein